MASVRPRLLAAGLMLGWTVVVASGGSGSGPDDDAAGLERVIVPFFQTHCIECHGGEKPEGEFSLAAESLDTDFGHASARGKWREIVDVLSSHSMPPKDRPQPDAADVAAVVDWITSRAVAAELTKREQSVVLRRLNRAEYRNTIRDLVGIDFDASVFPQDPPAGGFDNNGSVLTMSQLQVEQYLAAASEILDRALVAGERPQTIRWRFDPVAGSADDSHRIRLDADNNPIVNGGNNAFEGDWVVLHHDGWDRTVNARDFRVSTPGTYVFRARVAGRRPGREQVEEGAEKILRAEQAKQDAEDPARGANHQEWFDSHAAHFRTDRIYDYGPPRLKLTLQLGSQPRTVAEFDIEGAPAEPQVVELPVRFTTESAGVTLSSAYSIPAVLENFWLQTRDGFPRPEALIDWMEIEGPVFDAWPPTSHMKILFDSPLAVADPDAYVREVLGRFMREAYRRPVTSAEVEEKFVLFTASPASLPLVERIRLPLKAVLTSPHFLYLVEAHPADGPEPLSDHELAARLSYFLWSSQPDAELRGLADAGRLADTETRSQQVDRMLVDPKAEALVTNFAGQWLSLRDVGANPPAPDLYPQYDRHLEQSIVGESEAYFREFLRADLDVRGMIRSDFVTINERLARFYGIPDVRGDAFRKVPVPEGVTRGGIMTQASVLTITSNGTRTSPVKRGTWILKTLLGTDPGLPVANAGEIAPKVPGIDKATVRNRLEIHRALPQCARCHDTIDPLGFALENFNAAGEWRAREGFGYKGRIEANDPLIDASSRMPDGRVIDGVAGLQAAMLAEDDRFLESLARHLATYALSRELGLADRPLVAGAVETMKQDRPTLRTLIKAIVASDAFVTK